MLKALSLFKEKLAVQEKTPETVAQPKIDPDQELAFIKAWLQSASSKEWPELRKEVLSLYKNEATSDDEKNAKCDAINLLVLNAQLERQKIASDKPVTIILGRLTRITPEMINAIETHSGGFERVTKLSLCDGTLTHLPIEMNQFKNLSILHLTSNNFSVAPCQACLPKTLTLLNLSENPVQKFNKKSYDSKLDILMNEEFTPQKTSSKKSKV